MCETVQSAEGPAAATNWAKLRRAARGGASERYVLLVPADLGEAESSQLLQSTTEEYD